MKLVIASYFPWWGTVAGPTGRNAHWFSDDGQRQYLNTPSKGIYDSRDLGVIKRHGVEAKEAGIDAWAVSWWGSDSPEDVTLQRVLDYSQIPCALQFETPGIAGKGKDVVAELSYVLDKYASHSNFLKIDGRPVVFLYNPGAQQTSWPSLAANIHRPFLIADHVSNEAAALFDGVFFWGPTQNYVDGTMEEAYAWGRAVANNHGKGWCATVFPGYDDSIIRPVTAKIDRGDGFTLFDTWIKAMVSGADMVHVMSWNEWHEGSELEGSRTAGERYRIWNNGLANFWRRLP